MNEYNFGVSIEMVSEFMSLMGINEDDISTPQSLDRLKEIINYFKRFNNPRYELLKVLNKKSGFDNFEATYNYVQLAQEMIDMIKSLDVSIFDISVQKEISGLYLTTETLARIETDIAKMLSENPNNELYKEVSKKIQDIKNIQKILNRL